MPVEPQVKVGENSEDDETDVAELLAADVNAEVRQATAPYAACLAKSLLMINVNIRMHYCCCWSSARSVHTACCLACTPWPPCMQVR